MRPRAPVHLCVAVHVSVALRACLSECMQVCMEPEEGAGNVELQLEHSGDAHFFTWVLRSELLSFGFHYKCF